MQDNERSCCFSGHRPQKLPWRYDETDPACIEFKKKLDSMIRVTYSTGVRHYIVGMALGCDTYCAEAVIRLRRELGDITLEAAVPYRGQELEWSSYQQRRYRSILADCDRVTVLSEQYTPDCMMKRNIYMIDRSDVLVACFDGKPGGTLNSINYAMRKGVEVMLVTVDP